MLTGVYASVILLQRRALSTRALPLKRLQLSEWTPQRQLLVGFGKMEEHPITS